MLKTLVLQTSIVIQIFSTSVINDSNLEEKQLLSAVVLHRHGDRNPFTTYKTDPYRDESHWAEGPGQLTQRGIQRQYELGVWLNNRYNSMLPPRYSLGTIRAAATDVDRSLMSAEVTLAGFYPPPEAAKLIPNLNWQPIPVHTNSEKNDPVLAMKKPCRKFQRMFDDLMKSDHIVEINDINKNLFEFLSNKTGENIKNVWDVEIIYNTLHTQFLAGKILPDWASEVYPEKMRPAVALRFKMPCYHQDLARLRTGLFFGEIVRNFRKIIDGDEGAYKFLFFSGHDSTLADVLTTIGAFNNEVPPYSSAVFFELYKNGDGYFLNIFFKNSTVLHVINLEKCDFNCNFDDFTRILGPIVQPSLENWEEECEN